MASDHYSFGIFNLLFLYPRSPKGEGGILFYLCPSVLPSIRPSVCPSVHPSVRPSKIIFVTFFSVTWWQKSDIWSQASYRYPISWEVFLDPSDSYFLFADFVDFYTHWAYMLIFRRIFLSNYWWQKSDIWSQASYRYPILWEVFLDPSDSYFLFADFVDFYTHLTYICICTFFSSPGHRPCELLSWVSVRRPSVRFSHLNLLLWNRRTEISQTCQKCSLDGPLPDLCFWCWFEIQHGCQGP
jgi:hypothetical protein